METRRFKTNTDWLEHLKTSIALFHSSLNGCWSVSTFMFNDYDVRRNILNSIKSKFEYGFRLFPGDDSFLKEFIEFCCKYEKTDIIFDTLSVVRNHKMFKCKEKCKCEVKFWIKVNDLHKTGRSNHLSLNTFLSPSFISVYKRFIEHHKEVNMEFFFKLLKRILKTFSNTVELHNLIICDLIDKYKHSEHMWQRLAIFNFQGCIFKHNKRLYENLFLSAREIYVVNSIETYEVGLQNIRSKRRRHLMLFFINHLIDIRESTFMECSFIKNLTKERLEHYMSSACDKIILCSANHYLHWAEVSNSYDTCYDILRYGTDKFENDIRLWTEALHLATNEDNLRNAMETFEKGVSILKSDSWPLWDILLFYLQNKHPKLVAELYKTGLYFNCSTINENIKTEYMEWHSAFISTNSRLFHTKLSIAEKNNYKIFFDTIKILLKIEKSNFNEINTRRQLYWDACRTFGRTDIRLWADFIDFEFKFGSNDTADEVFTESITILEPRLKTHIEKLYHKIGSKFKNEVVIDIND